MNLYLNYRESINHGLTARKQEKSQHLGSVSAY